MSLGSLGGVWWWIIEIFLLKIIQYSLAAVCYTGTHLARQNFL